MKTIIVILLITTVLLHSIVCETGICSWYGQEAAGALTANGERFNPSMMTAAHKTLPFNTNVKVNCNGRSVTVRINDRGPFTPGRILDLSEGAAKILGIIDKGLCTCTVNKA